MKIAFIVRNYHKRGGISGYVAELAELYAFEHEVHVFAASFEDVDHAGIKCHRIPILSSPLLVRWKKHALNNLIEVWTFAIMSWLLIDTRRFTIVHSQGDYFGPFDVYTVHSCHKAWLSLASEGATGWEWFKKSWLNPLHTNILLAEQYSLSRAKRILAISEVTKQEIMRHYGVPAEKIEIVHHGVDIERFGLHREMFRAQIRKKHGLNNDNIVIVFPAHEFIRKGLPQIIEALHKIHNPLLCILVVGKDDPAECRALAEARGLSRNIIFAGVSGAIEQYYCAADMMVFPTAYEPFGLIITEAMACGLPVVVSKIAGAAELITDGVDGVLLQDHTDIDMLAAAIKLLASDHDVRSRMGLMARRLAEQHTWRHVATLTMRAYQRVVQPPNLNICVVSRTTLFHAMGGMEQHLRMLVEGLARLGHSVTVITTAHPKGDATIHHSGVTYRFLKGTRPGRYTPRFARLSICLFKQIHQERPFTVIHSESMGAAGLLAACINRRFRIPIVVIFHGLFINEIETSWGILKGTARPQERLKAAASIVFHLANYIFRGFLLVRRADRIISTSMKQKMLVERYFCLPPTRIDNVFNGVECVPVTDTKALHVLKKKCGITKVPVILCIARLKKEKGIHVALAAFAELIKTRPARLVIVGDGEYRQDLEALAHTLGVASKVHFAGSVDYARLGMYYTIADVFVNSTIRENGYDLTIVQAMGYQRPLIVTHLKALEGVVEHGVNGLLVLKNDVADLTDKLHQVLGNPEAAARMAKNAHATFMATFTADRMVDNTVAVYRHAVLSQGEHS